MMGSYSAGIDDQVIKTAMALKVTDWNKEPSPSKRLICIVLLLIASSPAPLMYVPYPQIY